MEYTDVCQKQRSLVSETELRRLYLHWCAIKN